jgi:hypothetical protein
MDISVSGVVGVWREERGWGGVGGWVGGRAVGERGIFAYHSVASFIFEYHPVAFCIFEYVSATSR